MAVNAAFIGRFYSFVSVFPVTICPFQCVRKILGSGKGEVRLRPELKGLVSWSTVLTREMSPARSCVTGGSPACNYSILKLNALRAAGQQIIIGKGTRVKAIHSQCRRCGPGCQGTGAWIHTQTSTFQCVRLDRLYLLQESVSSQQNC